MAEAIGVWGRNQEIDFYIVWSGDEMGTLVSN